MIPEWSIINKKRCIKGGKKDSFNLLIPPIHQAPAEQHGKRHLLLKERRVKSAPHFTMFLRTGPPQ
jgi:hypothetical protein